MTVDFVARRSGALLLIPLALTAAGITALVVHDGHDGVASTRVLAASTTRDAANAAPAFGAAASTTTTAADTHAPTTTATKPAQAPTTTPTAPATAPATAPPPTAPTTVPVAVTAPACRNSHDPACGPFRFDPAPGPDTPMVVEVAVATASPKAGQPVTFHVTLRDPDGVSTNGTTFDYGDGGLGGGSQRACDKYGPWDPPARDPSYATKTQDLTHTFAKAGTYNVKLSFEGGPFDCTDAATGRGDRPYASDGVGRVTVVVS